MQWLDQKMFFGSKYVYTRYGSDEEVVVRDDDEAVLSASDNESDDGEVSEQDEDNDTGFDEDNDGGFVHNIIIIVLRFFSFW